MEKKMRHKFTEEEKSLKRYYRSLLDEDARVPRFDNYVLNENAVLTLSKGMKHGRSQNTAALNEYIDQQSKSTDPEIKRLVNFLLDNSSEMENSAGTLLSEVQPQETPWLWYPRLALGKITMLDGDPGLGKSLIGADLAARITKGENMPDGRPCLATGGVVVIMPEDTLEDTIQPRFARAGADLSKVLDLSTVEAYDDEGEKCRVPFQIQNGLKALEDAIRRVDAKLVYIDPIMALFDGSINANGDDDVRAFLLPLKMLIEKLQVACILVRHMTKARVDNPLMAGLGSIAFIGLARAGLTVGKNPQDKSQVVLSHIKSNIGPLAPNIAYTISSDEGDGRPYLVWGNEIAVDVDKNPKKGGK